MLDEAWHVPAPQTRGTVLLLHGYAAAKLERLSSLGHVAGGDGTR